MTNETHRYAATWTIVVDIAEDADASAHAQSEMLMLAMHTFLADGRVIAMLREHLAGLAPDATIEHLVIQPLGAHRE